MPKLDRERIRNDVQCASMVEALDRQRDADDPDAPTESERDMRLLYVTQVSTLLAVLDICEDALAYTLRAGRSGGFTWGAKKYCTEALSFIGGEIEMSL